ncbi:sugar phosphate isomerase/epimerase [Flavobacteriaceae bacterium]|jgi:sugar phosphate isomerase/epimerase|nr:sugar phosphate isomerase/epimerase [Flavobacteriaceae bacterium]
MNRKSFIKTSALGVLAINTFPDLTLGIKKSFSNLKISITPWSLMRTGFGGDDPQGINVFDYPHIAKSLGFDFIDHEMFHFPPNLKEQDIERMNLSMEKAAVKSAVMLTGGVGDIGDADPLKRKQALITYKSWIDVAQKLGCKALRNVCGESISIPHKEKLKYAIEGVNELGDYAGSKGLDLLIENHNGYSSDPEWMTTLMESVNLKNVGILGDFTNWTLERNPDTFYPDPYKGIELLSPYIRAVSAKSENFFEDGEETTIDYQRMFDVLKKAPQLEFAGVEYFGKEIPRSQGVVKTKMLIEKVIKN